jgi:hypothetical protein
MLGSCVTHLDTTAIMAVRASHLSLLPESRAARRSAKPWGSCSRCTAAKPSDTDAASRRAAFFTAAIARASLACFFFLLLAVP